MQAMVKSIHVEIQVKVILILLIVIEGAFDDRQRSTSKQSPGQWLSQVTIRALTDSESLTLLPSTP